MQKLLSGAEQMGLNPIKVNDSLQVPEAQLTQSNEQFTGCCFNKCVLNGFRIFSSQSIQWRHNTCRKTHSKSQMYRISRHRWKFTTLAEKRSELSWVADQCCITNKPFGLNSVTSMSMSMLHVSTSLWGMYSHLLHRYHRQGFTFTLLLNSLLSYSQNHEIISTH